MGGFLKLKGPKILLSGAKDLVTNIGESLGVLPKSSPAPEVTPPDDYASKYVRDASLKFSMDVVGKNLMVVKSNRNFNPYETVGSQGFMLAYQREELLKTIKAKQDAVAGVNQDDPGVGTVFDNVRGSVVAKMSDYYAEMMPYIPPAKPKSFFK